MEQLTIAGWNVFLSEHGSSASRGRNEVSLDNEDFEVRAEEGSGYMSQSTTTYVPIEVVVRLLQQAGYTVTRGE